MCARGRGGKENGGGQAAILKKALTRSSEFYISKYTRALISENLWQVAGRAYTGVSFSLDAQNSEKYNALRLFYFTH